MDKNKQSKLYTVAMLIIPILIILLYNTYDIFFFLPNKSDYTKVSGTVVEVYMLDSQYSFESYLDAEYEVDGEVIRAEKIKCGFNDKVGKTINFYVDESGNAQRGSVVISSYSLYGALAVVVLWVIWVVMMARANKTNKANTTNKTTKTSKKK